MAENSQKGWKTLWEKEKLPATSNFSFSHRVFKRPLLQTRKNQGLIGKGLLINVHVLNQMTNFGRSKIEVVSPFSLNVFSNLYSS